MDISTDWPYWVAILICLAVIIFVFYSLIFDPCLINHVPWSPDAFCFSCGKQIKNYCSNCNGSAVGDFCRVCGSALIAPIN